MRYAKNLFVSIGIILMMSGCSAYVRTPDIVLEYQPPKDVAIGLSMTDVDVSKAQATSDYNNYANDMFSTLLNESKGSITRYDNQLFRLKVSLQISPTNIAADALIGVPSLFIPPLAFVPEASTDTYRVTYAIRDQYENIILEQDLHADVEGALQGYFVGRINAGMRVGSVKAAYAAKNAARLVLRDMNQGQNAETLVMAAKRLDNIDYRDANGETALMLAAKSGRIELAGRLLKKGADVNAVSASGDTAPPSPRPSAAAATNTTSQAAANDEAIAPRAQSGISHTARASRRNRRRVSRRTLDARMSLIATLRSSFSS